MNICFLAYDYPSSTGGGGVGNQVRILGRALVRAGHQVTVVAMARPGLPAYQEDEGVRIHRVRPGNLHWYVFKTPGVGSLFTMALRELEYAWAGYRLVRRLHRQTPFDIIEGTETGALGVALGLRDVPLVIRLHGEIYTFYKYTPGLALTPGLRLSRILQRMALRRARVLISPSQAHAHEIDAELDGKHPPITVIPNCIDLEQLLPQDDVPRDQATVLYVGRLERVKGVLLLLKAAALVVQQLPEVQFLLAGAPHPTIDRIELDNLITKHGLENNVHLLGHVPWEELLHLYQKATVCVLPSYYETFGLAALEPMAFGTPVIATQAGALPEIVEDGTTGFLIPPGDFKCIAKAIAFLVTDPVLQHETRDNAQKKIRHFFVRNLIPLTEHIYQEALLMEKSEPNVCRS
ncbi:MAG TPA: glycosyltransferase family 1 protein [Methylothermaceae bacterium]|nr:glycosyltransferase family 1 protein [Methylothermaceae bacterium]